MKKVKRAKYRVGIIGCGSHGTRLGRAFNLNPLTEVVAGVNRSQEGLDLFCNRFGVPGYKDYAEMLVKEEIDIAAPILPVKHNPQAVIDCARAGVKGIFCDKPIAASLVEADEMVEECRRLGVPVVAGDMERNDPVMWEAREMVESGEIGEVLSINVYGTGSNQVSGQGCRSFTDMAMFTGDAEIDWVVGWVTGYAADAKLGTVDEWSDNDQQMGGYVRFGNGIEAFLHHRTAPGKSGIEVLGTEGIFFRDSSTREYRLWKKKNGGLEDLSHMFDPPDQAGYGSEKYDDDGWYVLRKRTTDSVQAIVNAVESGARPRCSDDDLRKALEIPIALRESHRRGHAAVKLPLEDRSLKIIPCTRRWIGRRFLDAGMEGFMNHLASATNF